MTAPALLKRLAIVVGVLYLAVAYVAFIRLGGITGGLKLMDLRFEGYDLDAVQTYSRALGVAGLELYRETYLILDYTFLTALTALICRLAWLLNTRWFGWIAGLAGLAYFGFDIAENTKLLSLLSAHPEALDSMQADQAALYTQVKFAALAIAALALFTGWRRGGLR